MMARQLLLLDFTFGITPEQHLGLDSSLVTPYPEMIRASSPLAGSSKVPA